MQSRRACTFETLCTRLQVRPSCPDDSSHATMEKDRYDDVLSLSCAPLREEPSSFSARVRRYRPPFSFNYTTEAMIDTRLIVFAQKPLHASWYLMSTTKCSTLLAKCPRAHTYVRLNNDDSSRMYACMYVLAMARFMCLIRPFYGPRNATD